MILLDANILIYASNQSDSRSQKAKEWLEETLSTEDWVGIPWVSIWAFLRLTTNSRVMAKALTPDQAFLTIDFLLGLPNVVAVQPGPRHSKILKDLVSNFQATGPLVSDAVLAALAIEHGAKLASTDHDFSRFPGLTWVNPLPNS